jgi:hypothetical protein
MRALAVLVLTALALARPAAAAPHKILVLPVEGTADAATRTRLTQQIARLARALDGQVATAEATFADTALAVGCDPQAPGCSEEVMATLAVDELVWATATKDAGHTKLVVRRAAKGSPAREVATVIAASDPTERSDAGIAPLFAPPAANDPQATRVGRNATPPEPATVPPTRPGPEPTGAAPAVAEVAPGPNAPGPEDTHRDRRIGVAFAVGSGVALVLGIALWARYQGLQDSIDSHPTRTRGDFDDLLSLEDQAGSYAVAGDIFVVAGLAAGGVAAYYLVRDQRRNHIAITPAPIAHGAGLTLTILGGL